ncbi:sensor histidine kinase [Tahibacter soli]|uniref:Triple tyrosine motif-containing protein n=1 Tax=Tahibacter soli TaxID=2983605 RepID=A0A9X3YGW0_9GAMM|nr:sensor histidine kinase [Tahibacter soli]MDC8011449.1 triple tyrosine motif-containing protein [Tahibacter soli]
MKRLLGFCWLLACAATADAAQYRHTAWPIERGAPADVWALAQGRDGWLWLGTGNGLYRFDGVRYTRVEPGGTAFATGNITALRFSTDDTLWLGFFYGGAAALAHGTLTRYGATQGFPDGMTLAFAQTRDGTLWAASRGGLVRFDGARWRTAGIDDGYPAGRADWALVDRDGTLWVTTGDELVYRRDGMARFERTGIAVGKDAIVAQAPDGELWLSDALHGTRALPGLAADPARARGAEPPRTNFGHVKRLVFDRDGTLWGSDVARGGVWRVAQPRKLGARALAPDDVDAFFGRKDGLTSDIAVPLLEDAEGTLWAGTNLGLDSFRRNNVVALEALRAGPTSDLALAVGDGGAMWAVNRGALLRATPDATTIAAAELPEIYAAVRAGDGALWLQASDGFLRRHDGVFETIALPENLGIEDVRAIAPDREGGLWIAASRRGVWHWRGAIWSPLEPGELAGRAPTALAVDAQGTLWIGHADGTLARVDAHARRLYGAAEGLAVGVVTVVEANGDAIYVGGETGLARRRGERFDALAVLQPEALAGISGVVRSRDGDLWLNTIAGIVRVNAAEAERAFAEPGYRAAARRFDHRDGLPGVARQATVTGSALADDAGRLWFLTNQGIASIDPAAIRTNARAPTVLIEALDAAGTRYAAGASPRLPSGTSTVRVAYTATSLAAPDRVAFRYRLDGVDADWQDAGDRREAFYANLRPGDYRFRVIAANEDGVWNAVGAAFAFAIEPRLYQRPWFYALVALGALALSLQFYFWRLRLASDSIRLRFEERVGERERIARELHDTLLQGVQGLLLRLQALAAGLAPDDRRRGTLDAAIEQARAMLVEGRDRIVALRVGDIENDSFADAVRAIGETLAGDGVAFGVTVTGTEKPVCPPACEELLEIVREALRNAFAHANAARVAVSIAFDAQALRVRVIDDGDGIDEATLRQRRRDGHWGLVGMHERAAKLGATLALRRVPPHGTEVALTVPRRVAFRA